MLARKEVNLWLNPKQRERLWEILRANQYNPDRVLVRLGNPSRLTPEDKLRYAVQDGLSNT